MKLMKASGIGTDRTGIVYGIANIITLQTGNILRLNSLQVAGDYALTLVAEFPDELSMHAAMHNLQAAPIVEGFLIFANEIATYSAPVQDGTKYVVTAIGLDREGILESFSKLFWQRGLNLQSVQADVAAHMPMQGTRMFKSEFVITLPLDFDKDALFKAIEQTAIDNGLTVHITAIP